MFSRLKYFFKQLLPFLGRATLDFMATIGHIALFILQLLKSALGAPFYWRNLLKQSIDIGYYSLPVVGMTAIFTGAALALQTYSGFSRMHAEGAVAMVVVLSITRELAPVLTGLMLAGRVGAAIAAEIGTMRVTEQIDALHTLQADPLKYLVVPRVLAGTLVCPFLVFIADIIGVFGGYIVSTYRLGFNPTRYIEKSLNIVEFYDVASGLYKAAAFGFIVCSIGCYYGYYATKGASGVGRATTNAVVVSSVIILLSNYIITSISF